MADGQRNVELIIRATDNGGAKTFKDVAAAVDGVTASINDQVAAAKKGDVSAAELRDTMKSLQNAGAQLIKQQGLIDLYSKLSKQLEETEMKANGLRDSYEQLNNSGGVEGFSKQQTTELQKLSSALDATERKVATTQAAMAVQSQKLAAAGIGATELAEAQNAIAETATRVAQGLSTVDAALGSYNATIRQTKVNQAAINAELQKTTSLNAFRKQGEDALDAAAHLDRLGASEKQAAASTSQLAATLHAMLDPSAAAVSTLGGLETATTTVAAEIGDASKPIYAYTGAINELARVQSAIMSQAKQVDAFANQKAVVDEASAAYQNARAKVMEYGEAVARAEAPEDGLAASLRTARAELSQTAASLDNEKSKLDRMNASLVKAEIDTNDLTGASKRLTAASVTAAGAAQKLASAQAGTNSSAGRFLGLRPYELQNLSYQVNDVFTQLASGTKPMQVLAQQGGQVAQIFPQAVGAIIRFAPAIAAAAAVVITLGAAFKRVYDLEASGRKFNAMLATQSDSSRYSAVVLAQQAKSLSDLGVKLDDATTAVMTFTKSGLDPSQIGAFAKASLDMSKVVGGDVPAAATRMVEAFKGGYDAVAKLDDEFNFLTPSERQQIKNMFDSGQAADARTLAFKRFAAVMDEGAQKSQGPWTTAIKDLDHAWKSFLDSLGNSGIIQTITHDLADLAKGADWLAGKLKDLTTQQKAAQPAGGGLPGGVEMRGPVNMTAAGGLYGPPGLAIGGAINQAFQSPVITRDIDAIVRTVIGEARAGNAQGQQDVAAVILNRMQRSGQTAEQVVKQRGQFQPWDTKEGIAHLAKIDQNSEEYKQALQNILPILMGTVSDPTKGAVNFYSPEGQKANVANGLSKDLVPSFAQGRAPLVNRAGQQFFGGSFPGDKMGEGGVMAAGTRPQGPSPQQLKAGQDFLQQQAEQLALTNKQNDADTVRIAKLEAIRAAENAGADAASAQKAGEVAAADAQRKIDLERAQQRRLLQTQLASALQNVAAAQDADLSKRLDGITQKYKAIYEQIDILRKEGLKKMDNGQSLDDISAEVKAAEALAKQEETIKFYEQQITDIQKARADQVKAVQAKVDAGAMTPQAAVGALADINAKSLPQLDAVVAKGKEFAASIKSAVPDPKLTAFVAQLDTAKIDAIGENAKDSLKFYSDAGAELSKQQNDALAGINALAATGAISSTEAFKRAQDTVNDLSPKIVSMAQDALTFAEAMNKAAPNPQLQQFIANMKLLIAQQSDTHSTKSPAAVVGNAQLQTEEGKLNDILSARTQIVAQYTTMQEQGNMSEAEAQAKTAAAFAQFQPAITQQIAKINDLVQALHDAGVISGETFDAWKAKLAEVGTTSTFVSQNFKTLRDTVVNSFVQDTVAAFDTVTSAIGAAIVGTGTWKQAFQSLGSAALQFASSFLKSIADILLQMLALRAIQSLPGLNGFVNQGLQMTGLATSAAPLGAAGAAVATGGAAVSTGAGALQIAAGSVLDAAAAISASAAQLAAAGAAGGASGFTSGLGGLGGDAGGLGGIADDLAGLFHVGGDVGGVPKMSRRVNPAIFAGAPRYHTGRVGVGLSHNEQAAILKRGEEVLSDDNPRNMKNWNKGNKSAANGGAPRQRIVAVFKEEDIHAAMASSQGEQIVLAHISKNRATVAQQVQTRR